MFSKEVVHTFLKNQSQLFDGQVAETEEEAREFLEDNLAVVLDSIEEVQEYLEENGMDAQGLSLDELADASEVFELPDGRYLVVEA